MDSTDRCVCVTRATWAAVNQGALLPTATRAHLRMCSQWCWTTIRHCYFCGGLRNGNEWMTYTWHCPYLRTHEIHYYYFLLVLTKLITAFEKFRRTIRNRSEYGNNKFTASTDWLQVENSCQDKSDCGWVRLFRIHSVAPFPSRVQVIFFWQNNIFVVLGRITHPNWTHMWDVRWAFTLRININTDIFLFHSPRRIQVYLNSLAPLA